MSNTSIFIDLSESAQVIEVREFLRSKGADLSENASDNMHENLADAIKNCPVIFAPTTSPSDAESVLNSLVCFLLLIPQETTPELLPMFCSKLELCEQATLLPVCRRVLANLFAGTPENFPTRYTVYSTMVRIMGRMKDVSGIATDLKLVKKWCLTDWNKTVTDYQVLLRSLHDSLVACPGAKKQATEVMIELLGTYTQETASQATEDASRCVITSLDDQNTFLLSHLLSLLPVQLLAGDKIHELLSIFVNGRLADYMAFYKNNMQYVDSLGLSHERNVTKMRVLNLLLLAENSESGVVPYDAIKQEMSIDLCDIEQFVIDAVETGVVRAKINQSNGTVSVAAEVQRSFGAPQWKEVRDTLLHWQAQLNAVQSSLHDIVNAAESVVS